MINFAPVLIPTLNRFEHFKRCIESLSACTHAEKTDLFIFLDYPLKNTQREGFEIIKAYLPNIKGFKTVNVIEREKNYGAVDNFYQSLAYVFKRYDRLIFSEDDNVFAPNFLEYINKGLDKFEDDPLVYAVCGYSYPMKIPLNYNNNHYFSQGFSGWGFGIWKRKYVSFDRSIANVKKFLYNPFNVIKLNDIQYDLLMGLMHIVKSGHITEDRMYSYNNLINDTFSVFPTISKVRNLGHDGSGEHCSIMEGNNIFHNQVIDDMRTFIYDNINEKENKEVYKALRNHNYTFTKLTKLKKLKLFIMYLIFVIESITTKHD